MLSRILLIYKHSLTKPALKAVLATMLITAGQVNAAVESPSTMPADVPADAPADTPEQPAAPKNNSNQLVVVSPNDKVEMHVTEVPLPTVLRMLAAQSRRNIIASPNVTGNVNADLFNIDFREALAAVLMTNECSFVEQGSLIYVYTMKELSDREAGVEEEPMTARLFRLSYIATGDILPMIQTLLSDKGKISAMPVGEEESGESGEGEGNKLAGPDALLVYDYISRIGEIEKVINNLDIRPKQVLVEATILRAQLTEDNALGIDFNVLAGVDFQLLSAVSPGVTDISVGVVPQTELPNTNLTMRTDFNALVPNGGMTFGIIKDHIGAFIRAMESVSDTTVLANPKVLALNRRQGEVIVGRRDGYITTTVTETTATQSVEFLETGTRLVFRPFIGNDGFVRMEIHPEDSSGGLNEANLPFKRTTEVTTNIMVQDGHTILIGGLFRESTVATRTQVPIVGNLPFAGALFRTTYDTSAREEVIILLTVHIVEDDAYSEDSDKVAEDLSRLRLNMRRNLQPYGRERLSQAHYRKALEHRDAGRTDKALWDTNMTLRLNPLNLAANKLKEALGEQEMDEVEQSGMRDYIRTKLMAQPNNAKADKPAQEADK